MNPTPDTTADNEGSFDPWQAAALLNQTTQETRRRIEPFPAWLVAIRAFIALGIYGAVWFSVRHQHPYRHPTAAVIPVVLVLAAVNLIAVLIVARRATTGVSGRTRLHPAEIAVSALVWIGVFVVLGILPGAGVSDSIAYGVYPAAVPLIAAGVAWAGMMAARRNWRPCGTAAAAALVGVIGLFAGPVGAWAVAGVGLCIVLLATAAVIYWQQRRNVVGP